MKHIGIILLLFASLGSQAQNWEIKNHELSFTVGLFEPTVQQLAPNQNLDFMNYYTPLPSAFDDAVVKLGYRFDLSPKLTADFKLLLFSDLVPDCFDASVVYQPHLMWGLGLGMMRYKEYISYFEEYQKQNWPEFQLIDTNQRQFEVHTTSFYLSPRLKLADFPAFSATLECDLGLSAFSKEQAQFYQKRTLSNERMYMQYSTRRTFQPYVHPQFDARLQLFRIQHTSVGLLLHSNFYYSKRSMSYQRTLQQWTADNTQTETVKPPKHTYTRFEISLGVYVKW